MHCSSITQAHYLARKVSPQVQIDKRIATLAVSDVRPIAPGSVPYSDLAVPRRLRSGSGVGQYGKLITGSNNFRVAGAGHANRWAGAIAYKEVRA